MLDSVIHAAVLAACLFGLPGVKDPAVHLRHPGGRPHAAGHRPGRDADEGQLGGGTDIGQAVAYAAQLVTQPSRTIVVLITDFFEGGGQILIRRVHELVAQGCTCSVWRRSMPRPTTTADLAQELVEVGAHVGAMTRATGELPGREGEGVRRTSWPGPPRRWPPSSTPAWSSAPSASCSPAGARADDGGGRHGGRGGFPTTSSSGFPAGVALNQAACNCARPASAATAWRSSCALPGRGHATPRLHRPPVRSRAAVAEAAGESAENPMTSPQGDLCEVRKKVRRGRWRRRRYRVRRRDR